MQILLSLSGIQLRLGDGLSAFQSLLRISVFMLSSTCHCVVFTWDVKTVVLRTCTYRFGTWTGIWAHPHPLGINVTIWTDDNPQDMWEDQLQPRQEASSPQGAGLHHGYSGSGLCSTQAQKGIVWNPGSCLAACQTFNPGFDNQSIEILFNWFFFNIKRFYLVGN